MAEPIASGSGTARGGRVIDSCVAQAGFKVGQTVSVRPAALVYP